MNFSTNDKHAYFNDIKLNVRALVGICLGIFLFLLFFEPFNLQNPDFNNKLLTLAAFGGITLILLGLMRLVIPGLFPSLFRKEKWNTNKEIFYDFLFVAFNSVAYSFFARYVGKIPATFYVVTIIVIISISSIVILVVTNEFHNLKKQVKSLTTNFTEPQNKELVQENIHIEFESENKSEYFKLFFEQIILIKSANNYIEVIYKQDDKVSKKLIRNTLKNTEALFSKYPTMVRCHRSCIVNRNYIQKANKGSDGLVLTLNNYEGKIHVSRQYVLKVKEALKTNQIIKE